MSVGADKIISNIKADAQAKSDEIISKATAESEKILADGETKAEEEKQAIANSQPMNVFIDSKYCYIC